MSRIYLPVFSWLVSFPLDRVEQWGGFTAPSGLTWWQIGQAWDIDWRVERIPFPVNIVPISLKGFGPLSGWPHVGGLLSSIGKLLVGEVCCLGLVAILQGLKYKPTVLSFLWVQRVSNEAERDLDLGWEEPVECFGQPSSLLYLLYYFLNLCPMNFWCLCSAWWPLFWEIL